MSLDTRTKPTPAWLVREADVPGYHPANHTGTLNRRLIGPDTVGSRHVEVLLGVIERARAPCRMRIPASNRLLPAVRHRAGAGGGRMGRHGGGRLLLFPPDVPHVFTVTSDQPARLLVIYTPPYEESPNRVIRGFPAPPPPDAAPCRPWRPQKPPAPFHQGDQP